ncbi:MAG: hypothetical protein Q9227_007881 [Pyrenula ochraceoflavens]
MDKLTQEENKALEGLRKGKSKSYAVMSGAGYIQGSGYASRWPMSLRGFIALEKAIQDYRICHSLLLKFLPNASVPAISPIGVTVTPSIMPKHLWDEAHKIEEAIQLAYMRASDDVTWLAKVLEDLIENDIFTQALWNIHLAIRQKGALQDFTMGIFRSDYMIHVEKNNLDEHTGSDKTSQEKCKLRLGQIEVNTMATAGAGHATRVAEMHQYLNMSNTVGLNSSGNIPPNGAITNIVESLAQAHLLYGGQQSVEKAVTHTAILMIVQPNNVNPADERPIEYALQSMQPSIACYRCIFPGQVHELCKLGSNRELLYTFHDVQSNATHETLAEISVVYWRAGHEPRDYTGHFRDVDREVQDPGIKPTKTTFKSIMSNLKPSKREPKESEPSLPFLEPILKSFAPGIEARTLLESSMAIQCPDILTHLTTYKVVQAALAHSTALSRFVEDESDRLAIQKTFLPMHTFANSPGEFKAIVEDDAAVKDWILKPCLEGGGNNIHGRDIPLFLRHLPEPMWRHYILQKRVSPLVHKNVLMGSQGIDQRRDKHGNVEGIDCVSELGIFGTAIWKRRREKDIHRNKDRRSQEGMESSGKAGDLAAIENFRNTNAGWSLKTKSLAVKEMSVVKGYGCFDAPYFVEDGHYTVKYRDLVW